MYKLGHKEGPGLATDATRSRVQLDFVNKGMYVNNVKLEILNADEQVIYSNVVRQGETRHIVNVTEPIVPGANYWIRKTYYDADMHEVSVTMLEVEAYIGF